ncbi:LysR family transcriptional regulator [Alicyclobacillus contaminans]|uniref:LysR family transcriptional regulator n=1 Tax=Alicyclobacillus contaminans TaxID=392016 RepID=UPI0003F98D29|nr:LysR family transcriptional regulator [Alicyclobacillus contaminans]GMA49639.1 LysR family transcriptional regulator [Alicyclobacillus contaminans]
METKDIALFLAIARLGSISRTAEQLYMSQSTVTTRLQRLERALGYDLFIRTANGVQLSGPGQRFLPLAEQLVSIEQRMLHPDVTETPILRFMSGRAFVSVDVPQCLLRISRHMQVHLKVRMGLYDDMLNALLTHQVDFCFLGEPIYHPHVKLVEFLPDAIDLVVPERHHFVHNFPGIRALSNEPFVAFGRSSSPFRKRVMNLLAKENVYPNVRAELDSIDGIKAMVAHGLGVSFLPRRTLGDAAFKRIAVIPMNHPAWTRPTYIAYPDAMENQPITRQVLELISGYYQDLERIPHSSRNKDGVQLPCDNP